MKLVMAVARDGDGARAAAVSFDEWDAVEPVRTFAAHIARVDLPARGELDLRHLPVMLQLLGDRALRPEVIVIEGFVHLDAAETPGFGQHLYQALGGRTAILGISKAAAPGLSAQFEVAREEETAPLFVTCAGMDLGAAKAKVRAMHGKRRVPTLLKLAVRLAKNPA